MAQDVAVLGRHVEIVDAALVGEIDGLEGIALRHFRQNVSEWRTPPGSSR